MPVSSEPVRFQRPSLPASAAVEHYFERSRALEQFSNGGPCWQLLRERLADRVGAYCVPVASGTLGLMAALAALDHGRGAHGHALMPSFTFVATAQAASWAGLTPLLGDIDPDDWHLCPSQLEKTLRGRPSDLGVVLAVSAFGTPPPSETRKRWERACWSAGLPLIVDSAAAFGAVADDGVPIGAQGDVEVVSFHATKPFAVGEGGAVFTRDRTLHEHIELAVNFGLGPDRDLGLSSGLNAKMSEIHAATALAVLDEFDGILEARRSAAQKIQDRRSSSVTWQGGAEHSTWQFVPVAFADNDTREARADAHRNAVEVRRYYQPLHSFEPFRRWPVTSGGLAQTESLAERILCLPMANSLSAHELELITSVLVSASHF